jgi:hypothetical protein
MRALVSTSQMQRIDSTLSVQRGRGPELSFCTSIDWQNERCGCNAGSMQMLAPIEMDHMY